MTPLLLVPVGETGAITPDQGDWLSGAAGPYARAYAAAKSTGSKFSFDEFAEKPLIACKGLWNGPQLVSDRLLAEFRHHVLMIHGFDPGDHLKDAVYRLCLEFPFDRVRKHLKKAHDEFDRDRKVLGNELLDWLAAKRTRYNRAVIRSLFLALVARAKDPGCFYDYMVTLIGNQGIRKSTLLKTLAPSPDLFSDTDLFRLNPQQLQEALRGKWIVEIPEMGSFNRRNPGDIKAMLSRTHDLARRPWDRVATEQPRRCVIFGTTNEATFLNDATGNRRLLPLEVGLDGKRIDIDAIAKHVDQLFGEAVELHSGGASVLLPQGVLAIAHKKQEARMDDDPWMDRLSTLNTYVINGEERVTYKMIFTALNVSVDRQTPALAKRVGDCMLRLGWKRASFRLPGQPTSRGFIRTIAE